jgi:hypothetical protein
LRKASKQNYKPLKLNKMQTQNQSSTMPRKGDNLAKGSQQTVQHNQNAKPIDTVTPDNDNGRPGKPTQQKSNVQPPQFGENRSSNKDQGPSGENL